MIARIEGTVYAVNAQTAIIMVGGIGFRLVFTHTTAASLVPGSVVTVHTYLNVAETALDLYGFTDDTTLDIFQRLISISGVGPKLALTVLEVMTGADLAAAVDQNRPDLIAKTPGIGKKTAERIVIELRGKLADVPSADTVARMDRDADVIEALTALGYQRGAVRTALETLGPDYYDAPIEDRLKAALSTLGKR